MVLEIYNFDGLGSSKQVLKFLSQLNNDKKVRKKNKTHLHWKCPIRLL